MDVHRLSKISSSFNPFTEKTLAPGWLLLLLFILKKIQGDKGLVEGRGAVCTCDTSACDLPVCVCVCVCASVGEEGGGGGVHACMYACAGNCDCNGVVSVGVSFTLLCMTKYVL